MPTLPAADLPGAPDCSNNVNGDGIPQRRRKVVPYTIDEARARRASLARRQVHFDDMKNMRTLDLLAIGLLAFPVIGSASTLSISVGIDTSEAERVLHMQSTHEADRGIWVFPDANNKVYEYRFDSTFGGKISGVSIGDPISDALRKLGTPSKRFSGGSVPEGSYIFESSRWQIRVDVDAGDKIEMVLLLKGSAELTDPDRVREGVAPIFPRAKPVPHDPNDHSIQQPIHGGVPGGAPAFASRPFAGAQPTPAQIRCISLPEVRASMTPPVLYAAVRECIFGGRLLDADEVFRIAGLFWRFDVARVPDETAHGAGQVLIMNTMNSLELQVRHQFGELAIKMERDAANTQRIVAAAQILGPPTYYPEYMISHGLRPSPPKPDFDAHQEWANLLTTLSESVASQRPKDNDGSRAPVTSQ